MSKTYRKCLSRICEGNEHIEKKLHRMDKKHLTAIVADGTIATVTESYGYDYKRERRRRVRHREVDEYFED